MHHPTDRIANTPGFVTPVVEHRLVVGNEHYYPRNTFSLKEIRTSVCVCFLSILVLVAIFEMGIIFITRPPPSLISALFFIVCLCAFCFSIPVVVTIFVSRTIFMNCPPPSHSMWCFFVVCVHFFGSIIEL